MPLISLMKSEFVLIDQLLKGVRYGFLFEIDRTLIWWVALLGSALLALMHLFILVISFLFIAEHCGWTHCPHLLQLIQSILFCFRLLVFLIADPVSG